ncbi:hypothetical protein ACHAQD_011391 [Fusarium lateritium]
MPPRKRSAPSTEESQESAPKRRSLRQAQQEPEPLPKTKLNPSKKPPKAVVKKEQDNKPKPPPKQPKSKASATTKSKEVSKKQGNDTQSSSRATSEDPAIDSIPTTNPDAPKHDGKWFWLLKAEPETRIENGVDVKFSIDDLKNKTEPEGWDGIRAYAARNNMRNMNAGDLAFFYASNCKEPGIVGVMEIVKEFSEDRSARRPGAPYYDPKSTKEKPIWDLVHVEFRKKFAVPIGLKELRELGKAGGPLETMQLLKQSRLSVSKVSSDEWDFLCKLADEKASDAGLEHEESGK